MKRLLLIMLFLLLIAPVAIADDDDVGDDDDDDDDDDEQILGMDAEDLGDVALWTFVFTLTIVVWKPTHIYIQRNAKKLFENPKPIKKKISSFNRIYMRIHYWIGLTAVVVGGIHGLGMIGEDNGWMYWAGWAGMIMMTISGSLMLWKWPPKTVRKGARLLHAQRFILVLTIVLLWVAHD